MELHAFNVKSSYNLLSSLNDPTKLAKKASKLGYTTIAITDVNSLFGTFKIIDAFKKYNIKPIIGLELNHEEVSILLYAKNYNGYLNLAKIVTQKNKDTFEFKNLNNLEDVIVILPIKSLSKIKALNLKFKDLYYGYENNAEKKDIKDLNRAILINEVLYLEKNDNYYLDFIYAIKEGKIKANFERHKAIGDKYLLSQKEQEELNNSQVEKAFINKCNFVLPKNNLIIKYFKNNEKDPREYLVSLARKGLKKRLNNIENKIYNQRLKKELDIIIKMGFEDYFLIVWDFVKESKKRKILVGPGKGSSAGSLVSYALGITEIDPLEYGLLFERFLNPERITMPDIDIDFPDDKRKEVINYVRDKYGSEFVSEIITFGTFGAKSAFRDVARVLEVPISEVDEACRYITNTKISLKETYLNKSEFKSIIDSDKKLKETIKVASYIEGLPRHTSIHAAGIVLSRKPLDEVLPLVKSGDMNVAGYTMDYLEDLGLLKMDFLGIRNLALIDKIIKNIEKEKKVKLNFYKISLKDKKTLKLFSEGNTTGIFQFEGEGIKNLLRRINPQNFDDIAFCNALFRPGPMASIDSFIKRKNNLEKIDYFHQDLEQILKPTLGIIIYQEQIMLIATTLAGYTLGEADVLRRAMSKKKAEVLNKERAKFISGSVKKGYNKDISEKIFNLINKFANYGFNKSHTIAMSMVGFRMAFLKANYPKHFYITLLTNTLGNDLKTKKYLNEIKELNINIIRPQINYSSNQYEIYQEQILLPFRLIKGLNKQAIDKIIKERESVPFKDFYDFMKRCYSKEVNRNAIQALIHAGAFTEFNSNSNIYSKNIDKAINYAELTKDLDENLVIKPELESATPQTKEQIISEEKEIFGFYLNYHPASSYKEKEAINTTMVSESLNKSITITLMIESIKVIETKKGDEMAFLRCSDEDGEIDITLFPELYKKNIHLKNSDIITIKGKVEKRMARISIIANNIQKLNQQQTLT